MLKRGLIRPITFIVRSYFTRKKLRKDYMQSIKSFYAEKQIETETKKD